MTTRRDFFKKAAMMSGSAGLAANLLQAIQRASAIDPERGSTYLDAEHIVILMQENRSFDHAFGSLRGVRGFRDPRAVQLPDGNPVWLQTNAAGETYAPFRLNMKESKATWIGSLPHNWDNQTDARNHGDHDKWLDSKPSSRKECAGMPLTMGYYTREDIPFYYALADAFTICDQHFCSSLTGTTPNRLHLWTGTVRDQHEAKLRNSDVDYDSWASWTTFPERLEDAGISWKIYQNEIGAAGFEGEQDHWLGNFSDNPIEWFTQYHVYLSSAYRQRLEREVRTLPAEIEELTKQSQAAPADRKLARLLHTKQERLKVATKDRAIYTQENFDKLPLREQNLHKKAFTANVTDPAYHDLDTLHYLDGGVPRELPIPKGDVLHQFREDTKSGNLPAVSWIVAPENFSDHPSAPWYGQWYVAEVLNILTHNPEVWKKTIFVLTYDENDGYFDHVPPFVPPDPDDPSTGKTSPGIDPRPEYWSLADDSKRRSPAEARGGPIGLGYRVPLVVASPWSRGGLVCSQVFDHTSVLQFLETQLNHRTGKSIRETNISEWRRTVCGDLTAIFRPAKDDGTDNLSYPTRNSILESVHKAKFKAMPSGFQKISRADQWAPQQEKGLRPACSLPYELYSQARLSPDKKSLEVVFEAKKSGSPFHVYSPGKKGSRAYAVAARQRLTDSIPCENGRYHLRVCGPNGFLREFAGSAEDPGVEVAAVYTPAGDMELRVANLGKTPYRFRVVDHAYNSEEVSATAAPGKTASIVLNLASSFHWYDLSVRIDGAEAFERRLAGRVETGKTGFSDPAMS